MMEKDQPYKLCWCSRLPPGDLDEVERKIHEDIKRGSLKGLKKPGDLIFHTVFIGEDIDGPHVLLWGEEGDDDTFHCEWSDFGWIHIDADGNEIE
jgi:hypothetical protein